MDPLADKLTQLSVCICLAIRHKEFIIILCLLVTKRVYNVNSGIPPAARTAHKLPSSRWFGKVSTVVFYIVMIYAVWNARIPSSTLGLLVWIMLIFAALAFILYIPEFFKLKKKETGGQVTCKEIWKASVEKQDDKGRQS